MSISTRFEEYHRPSEVLKARKVPSMASMVGYRWEADGSDAFGSPPREKYHNAPDQMQRPICRILGAGRLEDGFLFRLHVIKNLVLLRLVVGNMYESFALAL
jgi:hypothetical protein